MSKKIVFSILFLIMSTLGVNTQAATSSCSLLLNDPIRTTHWGARLSQDAKGVKYFVFHDINHALEFLSDTHQKTTEDFKIRLDLLVPTMNGLLELFKNKGSEIIVTPQDKGRISAAVVMWTNTLKQTYLEYLELDLLYSIVIQITDSEFFGFWDHPITATDFSSIYFNMSLAPPENQFKKWMSGFDTSISKLEIKKPLDEFLSVLQLIDLDETKRVELANKWLKQDAKIKEDWSLEDLPHALEQLFLIYPKAALKFFKRHISKFKLVDLITEERIIRPLAYFKYVFKEPVPEFDQERLVNYFSPDPEANSSQFEELVFSWVSDLGLDAIQNSLDPETSSIEMDIFLQTEDGRLINIEADGPHHFRVNYRGEKFQRLADIRRDELLNALGITVYRIPYFKTMTQQSREDEELKLVEFLIAP